MAVLRHFRPDLARIFTSTSDGFTLLEVLVALVLSLVILLGTAPLWVTTVRTGVASQELLVDVERWRVVSARLERDLRMASAAGIKGLGCVPLLEATPSRLVLVTRSAGGPEPEIVAWEFAGGSLMRRRMPVPAEGPSPTISGFPDNKTMLEGVDGGVFFYSMGGLGLGTNLSTEDLTLVDAVEVTCSVTAGGRARGVGVTGAAGLGR
ncbi:MAG: prepilin-type N-terminal cleavage/methylation domain-containing protein [Thermoleophilia bacterium]